MTVNILTDKIMCVDYPETFFGVLAILNVYTSGIQPIAFMDNENLRKVQNMYTFDQ